MDERHLLVDLHIDGDRQGPGSDEMTRQAISLTGLGQRPRLEVADLGCGTGASTIALAQELDAHITAVDLLPEFLARLDTGADRLGLADRITSMAASMDELDFPHGALDAIWSEGAIYSIGFEQGVRDWRPFLRPGGILAVSELIWLTHRRPAEIDAHWTSEYPEVATASAKMAVLEASGYTPIGYFPLPEACWLDHYYRPLQSRFAAFLDRHDHSPAATDTVAAERHEIDLYERFSAFFGYGFFIARRSQD